MSIRGLLADTNGIRLSLTNASSSNAQWLSLDSVQILFSYAEPVGAIIPGCGKFANADFVGFSKSTTRHLNAEGFKDRPAIPGDKFARLIALAIMVGDAPTTLAAAWLEARGETGGPLPDLFDPSLIHPLA